MALDRVDQLGDTQVIHLSTFYLHTNGSGLDIPDTRRLHALRGLVLLSVAPFQNEVKRELVVESEENGNRLHRRSESMENA